jgi:glycosyltransferase involved in cell wall biosynthesis
VRKGLKFFSGPPKAVGFPVPEPISQNNGQPGDLGPIAPELIDGLAIYGFLYTETGVGQAARSLSAALATTDLPLSSHSITVPGCANEVEWPTANSLENKMRAALLAINADNVINLPHLMNPNLVGHNKRAGLFYWELPVFPGIWTKAFDPLDEVWVSSQFTADSLKSACTKPVHIVHLPVPLNERDPIEARKLLGLPADRLLYLVTFDFNSFPERKNPLAAVRAFVDAFPHATDSSPLLVIKCHGIHNRDKYWPELQNAVGSSKNVILIDRVASREEMLNLQAAIDVYVSLHRSEGFGLNLAECMAAGKTVIATNFSGNLDFTHAGNSLLVDFDMRRLKENEYVAWQGQWWADPRHDDAVSALRLTESQPALRAELGQSAKDYVAKELSFERVGAVMADHVARLLG